VRVLRLNPVLVVWCAVNVVHIHRAQRKGLNTIMGLEDPEGSLSGTGNVSCHSGLDAYHTVRIVKVKV
jgi:hypothetical protein